MSYGLIYQHTSDPGSGASLLFKPRYRLEILKKDYTGAASNKEGDSSPVVHTWLKDEAKPGIQGSSLTISLINDGTLPLTNFFSVNEDEFLVRFYWLETAGLVLTTDNLLFEGFLVQEANPEIMVDYSHVINLLATDGLGLLKETALDKAPAIYTLLRSFTESIYGTGDLISISIANSADIIVGDKIRLTGTSRDGDWLVISITTVGARNFFKVIGYVDMPSTAATVGILRVESLLDKITLASLLRRCLSATGLELNTRVYCNLFEQNNLHSTAFISQTLIDPQTFNKGNFDYEDCYSVLEKVLERLDLSLFQANGVWNIVRWHELRYYSNLVPGFVYNKDFTLTGTVTLPANLTAGIGQGSVAETGLTREYFRPNKLNKEKFDYKQPENLLRNADLQTLGEELRNYTNGLSGDNFRRFKEYKATWWYDAPAPEGSSSVTSNYFIRVITDIFDNEISRTLAVDLDWIKSYRIEANKDDILKFSFSVNTASVEVYIKLTDGVTTKWYRGKQPISPNEWGWHDSQHVYNNSGGAVTAGAFNAFTIDASDFPIPFDGHLYFFFNSGPLLGYEYKDIRLEYAAFINQSTKITGHTHKSEQTVTIKQKEEEDINVDDSPRNFIAGTLFTDQLTGVIQKRTAQWHRLHIPLEKRKLGNITTFENLFWRRKPRTKLEGTLYGLLHDDKHKIVSMLSVFKYSYYPTLNFVFGKLELDYKNDRMNCTMWEMYTDGEVDADLTSEYEFKYLYETQ